MQVFVLICIVVALAVLGFRFLRALGEYRLNRTNHTWKVWRYRWASTKLACMDIGISYVMATMGAACGGVTGGIAGLVAGLIMSALIQHSGKPNNNTTHSRRQPSAKC